MSAVEEQPGTKQAFAPAGMPWQAIVIWALGIITTLLTIGIGLVSWIFLSTTTRIEQNIKDQGNDVVAIRKQLSDNQLEIVERIDSVDKNLAIANGRIDGLASLVRAARAQPTPVPPK